MAATDPPRGLLNALIRFAGWTVKARTTHGAVVCVVNAGGEVLLVRQRLRERGHWGLPGGYVDRGESPVDAAVRELREETGLDVGRPPDEIAAYFQPWAQHYDHVFIARVRTGYVPALRSVEISEVRWFSLNEPPPPLTASSREAFRRIRTSLLGGDDTRSGVPDT